MDQVVEPSRSIPVLCDVDVAVAGAGVAGVFAALAAARQGARTVLIDRFGSIGGNIGPGMINNGHMVSGQAHPKVHHECTVYPRLYGLAREFLDRYAALGGGSIPPLTRVNYPGDASIASYVAQRMLEESGVRLLLSTWTADPLLDGQRVRGLFVENKSGRQAVRAGVVVDATGEADVARRTSAPVLYPKEEYHELDGHAPTGMGLYYLVGGIRWDRYESHGERLQVSEEDLAWGRLQLGERDAERAGRILPLLRRAVEAGTYRLDCGLELDGVPVGVNTSGISPVGSGGLGHGRVSPKGQAAVDAGNGLHMAALEAALRARAFETFRLWREGVPGFEDASLLCISPFLGVRGGPCIAGEYTLTMDDCRAGRRFDDVIYLYGEFRALRWTAERGDPKWVDVPYRVMVPRGIDGLLAVGRSASGQPDTLLRNRMAVKVMGQAGGTAAALCAAQGVMPRELDVRQLQIRLLDQGFYLGDRHRLRELGLT
ncbi:MAG: FAD-dependent oxidoreductase [Candidatus Latescibacterota bacterium]